MLSRTFSTGGLWVNFRAVIADIMLMISLRVGSYNSDKEIV